MDIGGAFVDREVEARLFFCRKRTARYPSVSPYGIYSDTTSCAKPVERAVPDRNGKGGADAEMSVVAL